MLFHNKNKSHAMDNAIYIDRMWQAILAFLLTKIFEVYLIKLCTDYAY